MTERSRPNPERTRFLFGRLNSLDPGSVEHRRTRDELVSAHMPLVRYLARRFAGRGEPSDDLVQIGTIGLLQAIDRFEPARGLEFSTFATPNIVGEIKRHFRGSRNCKLNSPRVSVNCPNDSAGRPQFRNWPNTSASPRSR
jgi:RNA polymerase sigma-B factor